MFPRELYRSYYHWSLSSCIHRECGYIRHTVDKEQSTVLHLHSSGLFDRMEDIYLLADGKRKNIPTELIVNEY